MYKGINFLLMCAYYVYFAPLWHMTINTPLRLQN